MSVFSERLSYILKSQGVTQAQLSSLTGIPKSAVSQYVSGKFSPRQDRVYLICKVLDVSPAWITGYDANALNKVHADDGTLSDDEQRLIKKYRTDNSFREWARAIIENGTTVKNSQYDIFRAAKSKDGTVAPSVEKTTHERVQRLSLASETDEDL